MSFDKLYFKLIVKTFVVVGLFLTFLPKALKSESVFDSGYRIPGTDRRHKQILEQCSYATPKQSSLIGCSKSCDLFFFKWANPASFVYFRSFQTIFKIKTVDFSRIRTQIDEVEGEHADHLTTTTVNVTSLVNQGALFQPIITVLCYSKICLRHRFNSKDDNYGLKLNAAVGFLGVSDRDQSAVWDQCSKTCFALSRMSYNFGNILAQNLFGCTYLLQICIVNMKRFSAT